MVRAFRSFIHQESVTTVLLALGFILICSTHALAEKIQEAETMIQTVCSGCHKFQGEGESRFHLKAPDVGRQQVSAGLADWMADRERTDAVCQKLPMGSNSTT